MLCILKIRQKEKKLIKLADAASVVFFVGFCQILLCSTVVFSVYFQQDNLGKQIQSSTVPDRKKGLKQ
jgi:hypothetical protein